MTGSHVRSKLIYGCVVYGSARPSHLALLDRVQTAALRVCLGAFRTYVANTESPCGDWRDAVDSEAGETVFAIHNEVFEHDSRLSQH